MNLKKIAESCLDNYVVPNSKSIRDYIDSYNNRFSRHQLGKYKLIKGAHNQTVDQVLDEYRFYDIRKTDFVLDIGAHVGAFSMFISQSVKHVYAVEPLFTDILKMNINNNGITNIEVLDIGLGGEQINCFFMNRQKIIKCEPLSKILKRCGEQIDFLKCDCEGGEWGIAQEDLKGIRRVEMELHCFHGGIMSDFLDLFNDFDYSIDQRTDETWIIHATRMTE